MPSKAIPNNLTIFIPKPPCGLGKYTLFHFTRAIFLPASTPTSQEIPFDTNNFFSTQDEILRKDKKNKGREDKTELISVIRPPNESDLCFYLANLPLNLFRMGSQKHSLLELPPTGIPK